MTRQVLALLISIAWSSAQAAPFLPGLADRYAPDDYSPYPSLPPARIAPNTVVPPGVSMTPSAPMPYGQQPYWGTGSPPPNGYPAFPYPGWGAGNSSFPWGGSAFPGAMSPFGWW